MSNETLTLSDAVALGLLADWVSKGRKVRWSTDEGVTIRSGVLRHFVVGPGDFSFPRFDSDLRDQFVRITDWGTEHVLSVREIAKLLGDTMFVIDKTN